jgi:transposase, IS5 family
MVWLSDYEVEDRVNDSISFSRFVGISLDDSVPDHSVLSRFRTELTEKGVYEKIFKALNKQLDKHKILVKTGAIIDASIIDSPLKPKGTVTYEIESDRAEIERSNQQKELETKEQTLLKVEKTGVDAGDKGYASAKNEDGLKKKNIKSRILSKAKKGKPLTEREKLRNKLIGKTRFKVERTFGSIKRWFNSTHARYKGITKMHTQNLMEAIAYNLYRSPGRVASNSFKMAKI